MGVRLNCNESILISHDYSPHIFSAVIARRLYSVPTEHDTGWRDDRHVGHAYLKQRTYGERRVI